MLSVVMFGLFMILLGQLEARIVVTVVTRLWPGFPKIQGLISSWERDFSLHSIQTGAGAHPASYPVDTAALSTEVKWPGHEADH
jgi:hypothetical protein